MSASQTKRPVCPVCKAELQSNGREIFDCENCGARLQEARGTAYAWVRALSCLISGSFIAWKKGWWGPFTIIFAVMLSGYTVFLIWKYVESNFFPAKEFEVVASPIQTMKL